MQLPLFAQGDGAAGIEEATEMVTSYFDPAAQLIYAIGGGNWTYRWVKGVQQFNSVDPDSSKTAASWLGVCISQIVAATILR